MNISQEYANTNHAVHSIFVKVRRLMGKPRRCSEAFFSEERAELDRKRKKMRLLQQRKMGDSSSYRDLPEDIPMQLTIGSKVTARFVSGSIQSLADIYDD